MKASTHNMKYYNSSPQQQHDNIIIMASSSPESGNPTRHTISTAKTCQSLSDDLVLNSSGSQVPSN